MKEKRICIISALMLSAVMLFAAAFPGAGPAEASSGGIKMVREALELFIGETDTLVLTGSGKDAAVWKSSDDGIVTVDADGNVKGIAAGTAEITAESGGNTAVCKVFVVEKEYSFDDDIMISVFWPPTKEYINDEQYKYMADAGITYVMGSGDNLGAKKDQLKMLELCYKYGIRMTVGDSRLGANLLTMSEKAIKKVVEEYRNVPAANGYYMLDEPFNPNDFINAYKILKSADPNSYMHLNFLPYGSYGAVEIYKAQMNDWLRLCEQAGYKQDYLMYDLYPFGLEKGSMNRTAFLINLNAVREIGLKNGVKTGTYIQSVTQSVAFRSPTESETRYEINMALAFGIKQLSYFTWFTPYNRSEPFEDGIISYQGVPNPKYEFICRLNGEVKNLGPTLVKCDSLEIYESKSGYGAMDLIPEDFFVQSTDKSDFTVAYLRHKETGRNYCMVVNNNFSKEKEFSLKFDGEIKSLQYLSEKDGKIYAQELDAGNVASFSLDAGGARLFVLPEGYDFSQKRVWNPAPGENLALHAAVTCDSSLGSGNWYMCYLNDGKRFSGGNANGWQPAQKAQGAVIVLDFDRELEFNRIDLYPAGNRLNYGENMPSDFVISVSNDGENWYKLASATGFSLQGTTVPSLRFPTVKARYIRMIVNKFNGNTLQLAEIEVYRDDGSVGEPESVETHNVEKRGDNVVSYKSSNVARDKKVEVSSYPTSGDYKSWGWWPDFLVDGDYSRGFTSNVKRHMDSADNTEYAIIDFGDRFSVDRIEVYPNGCWPVDFDIRLSTDGKTWTTVASEKNSSKPDSEYTVDLGEPVTARYLMFIATKLRKTSADGYMLQLAEIAVNGKPYVDRAEAETLMKEYIDAGGSKTSKQYTDVESLLSNEKTTQSQLDAAMKKMLGSVGKTLPEPQTGETEKADYKFEIYENPMNTPDDTPVPTELPETEPTADSGDNSGRSGKGSITAAVIAGIAIAAAAITAGAVVIAAKKKKSK